MGKHYIVRSDGVVHLYNFKESNFRKNYTFAYRTRKLHTRRRKGKWMKIRVYVKKIVYFSIYVVNTKGSGVNEKRGSWSFTVDASIYTTASIDEARIEGLGDLAEALAEWLVDEFGFRNAVFTTVGSQTDAEHPAEDAEEQGLFIVNLDVEDVTMAQGDYRLGRNIESVNACMLDESCKRESYSVKNLSLIPRMAFRIRLCK